MTSKVLDCSNPRTSKMLDGKIQTDLTHVKTIQYDTVGRVLDCFYTNEEAWFFHQSSKMINNARLDNPERTKQMEEMLNFQKPIQFGKKT